MSKIHLSLFWQTLIKICRVFFGGQNAISTADDAEVRRTGIIVDLRFQNRQSSVRSDIMLAVRKDYAAPTELEPMRMTNYKDAAPTALKMPPGQRGAHSAIQNSSFAIVTALFLNSFWVGRWGQYRLPKTNFTG